MAAPNVVPSTNDKHADIHRESEAETTQSDSRQVISDDQPPKWTPVDVNFCDSHFVMNVAHSLDKLKDLGVDLAKLHRRVVVCGLRSQGKRTVLAALLGFLFPVCDIINTKYVTEINFKRAHTAKFEIGLRPANCGQTTEPTDLIDLGLDIRNNNHTDIWIPWTKLTRSAMDLIRGRKVARDNDVLVITLSCPTANDLTLIDLPGFSSCKSMLAVLQDSKRPASQGQMGYRKAYLMQPDSTVLFVMPAMHAKGRPCLRLQESINLFDQDRSRTIGIVTKPELPAMTEIPKSALTDLTKHQGLPLQHGWHALHGAGKASTSTAYTTLAEAEAAFFAEERSEILSAHAGARSLLNTLTVMHEARLRKKIPKTIGAAKTLCTTIEDRRLANPPSNDIMRRSHLQKASQRCQNLIRRGASCEALYDHDFYITAGTHASQNKLRQLVEEQKSAFRATLERSQAGYSKVFGVDKDRYIAKVLSDIQHGTLEVLSGHGSTPLVNRMFIRQVTPWHDIAKKHCDLIVSAAKAFLSAVLKSVFPEVMAVEVEQLLVAPVMAALENKTMTRLQEVIDPYQSGILVTLNDHYFRTTLRELGCPVGSACRTFVDNEDDRDVLKITNTISRELEKKRDYASCLAAVNVMLTHYKIARKDFADDFSKDCIEMCLMNGLIRVLDSRMKTLSSAEIGVLYSDCTTSMTDDEWSKLGKQRVEVEKIVADIEDLLEKRENELKKIRNGAKATQTA